MCGDEMALLIMAGAPPRTEPRVGVLRESAPPPPGPLLPLTSTGEGVARFFVAPREGVRERLVAAKRSQLNCRALMHACNIFSVSACYLSINVAVWL